jgi:glycerate kinase
VPDDAYERGVSAGEIAQRLREHDQHFAKINGSMGDVARELHGLTLAVQRLGDAADADRATVITTATALEKADQARRDTSERHWSPLTRLGIAAGIVVALATVITLVLTGVHT